ncbi:hypothetical protein AMAG_16091 [Allomyces macrogynus ATCC 38327]|uniref:Tetratricopeptide repeat protein 39B n=1 Tax=Allomyces macrogynus (strain ATCC 38327) TaxID=578462 RepID=A0A0L0TAN9_ALLM3|nr:hypothetical protein AMAG_16091 [Allomyces macrogynus ATCC 38327]|eukprot:KNE71786.1 hypothetical protein AMAG_16091 [Allomyces macrogynus ATCC 38327]
MSRPTTPPRTAASDLPLDEQLANRIGQANADDLAATFPITDEDDDAASGVGSMQLTQDEEARVEDIGALSVQQLEQHDAEVLVGIDLFFQNQFDAAHAIMRKKSAEDALFALADGLFAILKALTTFDPDAIQAALSTLQRAEALASTQYKLATPKPTGSKLGQWIRGGASFLAQSTGLSDSAPLAPGQMRSTVIRAEAALLSSTLHLFQESILGMVRSGLCLRKAQKSYSQAWAQYNKGVKEGEVEKRIDLHTRSGVLFGIGGINMGLSILPAKVLKVIAILGVKGNKQLGFDLLRAASATNGARAVVASLFMSGYNAIHSSFAPELLGPSMVPVALRELLPWVRKFPSSPFHLLMLARALRTAGLLPEADLYLDRAYTAQSLWPELALLCAYEQGINAMMRLQWDRAAAVFADLGKRAYWSPAFFVFAEGACRAMAGDVTGARACMERAPAKVVRKYGGRVISVEQYILRKVELYAGRDAFNMYNPGLELLLIWNAYPMMSCPDLATCRATVLATLDQLAAQGDADHDALAVQHLILAAIEKALGDTVAATRSLEYVLEDLTVASESWVPPFAAYHRAVLEVAVGAENGEAVAEVLARGRKWLGRAGKATEFNFEFRLALRIHLATLQLDEWAALGDALDLRKELTKQDVAGMLPADL